MKIETRLSAEPRKNLGRALPLEQPYVLLVDPSSLCNLRCKWCPSGYDQLIAETGRSQQVMDLALFERLVDQAAAWGKPFRVLRMYKEGEPLVNPFFADMVRLAKQSGWFLRIDTTTNGVLLNPKLNRKLIDTGIDQINISVNGMSAEQIYRNTGNHVDFGAYVQNIQDLCGRKGDCTIYIKSIKDVLSDSEQEQFFDIFGDMADRVYLERLSPAWPAFDVSQSGYTDEDIGNYEQPVENRMVCPYLFYIMVVNADGSVSTCVGDWRHEQTVGDIKVSSLKEIWLGEIQQAYQLGHLMGEKDRFPMCSKCAVITHGCYDNIDAYAQKISEKLVNHMYTGG